MTKLSLRSCIVIFFLIAPSSDGFVLNSRQTCVTSPPSHSRHVFFSTIDDSSTSSSTQSPAPLATVDDWSAYLDESKGLLYYFNRRTGKSQWEPPANVVFPEISMSIDKKREMRAQLKSYLKKRLNDSSKETNIIDDMEKDRRRIEMKRREAAAKLNAKMSKLEEMKIQQQQKQQQLRLKRKQQKERQQLQQQQLQQQQAQLTSNSVDESTPTANRDEPKQQSKERNDAKPTSLPIVQQGEWSAYFDIKSGLVFYYNEETKVSLWDPPTKEFPRVIMENNNPKVIDPRTSNISMERALTMTMEEDEAKRKWEEAKQKEKARKAKLRAVKAVAENVQKKELANEEKLQNEEVEALQIKKEEEEEREEAVITTEQQRLQEEDERIAREEEKNRQKEESEVRAKVQAKYEAAKAAELRRLQQERIKRERKLAEAQVLLDKERLEKERAAAKKKKEEEDRKAAEQIAAQATPPDTRVKQPTRPKEEPTFTVDDVENMVAPLISTETISLYDILQCPPDATRSELKRAYLTLAKETHPDALLQAGMQNDEIATDRFVEISQAWKVLGDSKLRRRYDRELRAKGVSNKAGNLFETWVMGAAKKMDEALSKAEDTLDSTPRKDQ